jgi:quercetin dioxygenase-like cupin family protein
LAANIARLLPENLLTIAKFNASIMNEKIAYASPVSSRTCVASNFSGNSYIMHFDSAGQIAEKKAPFDIFAQIIDGLGEIIINGKSYLLTSGESITIPALKSHIINAKGRLKILLTVAEKDSRI